jgi:hypothetical protein
MVFNIHCWAPSKFDLRELALSIPEYPWVNDDDESDPGPALESLSHDELWREARKRVNKLKRTLLSHRGRD